MVERHDDERREKEASAQQAEYNKFYQTLIVINEKQRERFEQKQLDGKTGWDNPENFEKDLPYFLNRMSGIASNIAIHHFNSKRSREAILKNVADLCNYAAFYFYGQGKNE